jgi:hypothetical protein
MERRCELQGGKGRSTVRLQGARDQACQGTERNKQHYYEGGKNKAGYRTSGLRSTAFLESAFLSTR